MRILDRLRFYVFSVRWLWSHRGWETSRQKYKALDRGWTISERERKRRSAR